MGRGLDARGLGVAAYLAIFGGGCASSTTADETPSTSTARTSTAPASSGSSAFTPSASASGSPSPPAPSPEFTTDEARALLFPEGRERPDISACNPIPDGPKKIRCYIESLYEDDEKGLHTALALYDELGAIPGLEHPYTMEGGFRGMIKLVPERPIGQYQKHFDWVLEAQREIAKVFIEIDAKKTKPVGYRYRPVGWKFLRSVGRTTPSAYADDWRVGYNVSGSLNSSAQAVRDTLVHEIFHLNDDTHKNWSRRTLGHIFDAIVAKCGTKVPCLAPYAPMKTQVRGGTYYAFQPDNGDAVHEYAAELASRYFIETKAALDGAKLTEKPFKCGPSENAESWRAIVDEFFGGVDLVPACN